MGTCFHLILVAYWFFIHQKVDDSNLTTTNCDLMGYEWYIYIYKAKYSQDDVNSQLHIWGDAHQSMGVLCYLPVHQYGRK